MKNNSTFLLLCLILAWSAVSGAARGSVDVAQCPGIGQYRIEPYLKTAIELQGMGKDAALQELKKTAAGMKAEFQVIVLCRMLFVQKPGGEFRSPQLGSAVALGGVGSWPLEPIAIESGVPILITRVYSLAGKAEPGISYLEYCVSHGEWNPFRFAVKTKKELQEIVRKFVAGYPWIQPLNREEELFLEKQAGQ